VNEKKKEREKEREMKYKREAVERG